MTVNLRAWGEDFDGRRYTGTWRYRTEHLEIIVYPSGSAYYMSCARLKMDRINLCATTIEDAKKAALATVRAFIVQIEREVEAPVAKPMKGKAKR